MIRLPGLILTLLISAPTLAEDAGIAALMARNSAQGTLVISSLASGQTFTHNDARATQRFTVASTFKILNTLIALQENLVASKDAPFKWDGTHYSIASWNQDQTLESAFRASCVWCYQQLARQIGVENYREYLHAVDYGALHEPFVLTTFWLDGSLTISAQEQVVFLKQVYQRTLPFSPAAYDTLQQIMLSERTADYSLYTKTGLAGDNLPKIGWYVGYVETANDVWFFATNLDITDERQLPLRLSITHEALQAKGVLP